MKNSLTYYISLLLVCVFLTASASAEEIRISAAASLTEAVKVLVGEFQQNHSDIKLLPNFASSGALAKQIYAGAPADIYISANPKWMDYLEQQELVSKSSREVLVQNRLVVVSVTGNSINSLQQLTDLSRIAICSPKSSPAGKYAEQALTAAGIYSQLLAEQKLILAKDVRQALLYADRGEADAAFVYGTDAQLSKQAQTLFAVPQELYPHVVYPAALTIEGSRKSKADSFFRYLFSESAQEVFKKYGFLIPE